MLKNAISLTALIALSSVVFLTQGQSQVRRFRPDINIQGNADRCSDLRVESRGEVAQTTEAFTLRRNEVASLEINALDRGHVRVIGGNNSEYAVEVCKVAVAETRPAAEQMVRGISVFRSAGHLSTNGPSPTDGDWLVYFIVHAPADANLDLETRNGAIEVRDVRGNIKARATNGPLAFNNCGGLLEAHTANGPIAFQGGSGEVHLTATNGPISVNLSGDMWNGSKLDAHTDNGPVSLRIPDSYQSGVRVETSGHSPISCASRACTNALTQNSMNQRIIQLNGSSDTVRVSTNNGPVSVGAERPGKRII